MDGEGILLLILGSIPEKMHDILPHRRLNLIMA